MLLILEIFPRKAVTWECSLKNDPIQLYMLSGRQSKANFSIKVLCLTLSNAFEKSMAYTMTYWLVSSILVMECKILIRAAVVDPVGWNAY